VILSLLSALAWPFVQAFTLFVYFLAFVTVYRAHLTGALENAAPVTRALCWIIVGMGFAIDVTFNATVGSVILAGWPRHWTFTSRCSSHLKNPGWRGDLCRWICAQLDVFQEGGHCER
jgi:hypothetical protein